MHHAEGGRDAFGEFPPSETSEGDFLGAQFDAGLAFIDFPEGDGGLGLPHQLEVMRMTRLRADAAAAAGGSGPEGSLGKLVKTEIHKRIFEFCVDLLGPQGLIYDSYEMRRPEFAAEIAGPARNFLRSRAQSIEGGTSEVQRNIIAERLLGLPRDPHVDKGLPWTDIPRN